MAFVELPHGSARERLRWGLADEPRPQTELFPGLVRRVFGRGEFRGLEFLEVEAKSIVNEVPAASAVPFRHTINAYRGCSHACTYCAGGDTPILMGNGRAKPLHDVRVGDGVYGTVFDGKYRRYVVTEVLDHWQTVKPAYRVTLEDGTELVASGDHRFLTGRGWKHVTGTEHGPGRRPHLTTGNSLMGTGRFSPGPDHGPDYRRGYLCGARGSTRPMTSVRPLGFEALQRVRLYLTQHDLVAEMLVHAAAAGEVVHPAVTPSPPRAPGAASDSWFKGFLAGIFDAEGSCSRGVFRICNKDPEIIRWITVCMERLGFRFTVEPARANGVRNVRLLGGLRERLRFFHAVDPAITRKRSIEGTALKSDARLRVTAVEPLGIDMPMYDITTGTGDFIADGVVSHNCFARPTHEYLNLDIGRDFETKLVVKVNAVERLRAELHPRRWAGGHIAMGTNTDPYQRAEGKYRLTRGIVEVLSEHRNPFSILTKSTLILRDLDLLAGAAQRASVAANFSIGTLDEDVWKLTEPGTPHPRQRVEAVARLNEAGIPCGVLVAPILPGLSDGDGQIDEVVGACVEAGARSITPVTLHLRPGVREHYMGWLREHRPDLVRRYREIYRRSSYAPKELQHRVADKVRAAVERHGGLAAPPGDARRVEPPPLPAEPPPAEQLGLAL